MVCTLSELFPFKEVVCIRLISYGKTMKIKQYWTLVRSNLEFFRIFLIMRAEDVDVLAFLIRLRYALLKKLITKMKLLFIASYFWLVHQSTKTKTNYFWFKTIFLRNRISEYFSVHLKDECCIQENNLDWKFHLNPQLTFYLLFSSVNLGCATVVCS